MVQGRDSERELRVMSGRALNDADIVATIVDEADWYLWPAAPTTPATQVRTVPVALRWVEN